MSDLRHRFSRGWLRRLYGRQRDADTTLGIAMAVIAMLFIAGIITAFIHAADTNAVLNARAPAASPPAETTGSGNVGR